ncbi:hypothetical protein S7711_02298 [Stachybotrys chartarum IBT 7711]|uniref:Aminoglycoside phosphotransferase domain-containing protein n=1 Tax=Stachybotrys chartarum (strain CBS 109288 / IBT 7711) TaxID=1280523 RepID=A0A084B0V8_STACB|nr:hypothetical protein S7711_02298 [Stachybotrys chartarum IBT 7711]
MPSRTEASQGRHDADKDSLTATLTPSDTESESDLNEELPKYLKFRYPEALVGKEIHSYWGHRVLEHTTSKGEILALKVDSPDGLDRLQADMMHYAATHGVLAPKVRGVYDVVTKRPIARVMVSERVPGVSLASIWRDMSQADQESIKTQLRAQLGHMRTLTQPYIGRIGKERTRNVYNTTFSRYCGPFDTEEAFDTWCLRRLYGGKFQHWKWQRVLERKRRESSGKFVLTHGDLSPRNIMVEGNTITGIIDWELSGFYPEYMEYAIAMGLGPGLEEWWIPVLKEILEPCSKDLVKFTRLIEERMSSY